MRIVRVSIIGAVLVTAGSVRLNGGQMLPAPSPPWSSQTPNSSQKPDDSHRTQQQEKLRIIACQKRLVTDANKLLLLATDLKARVDKPSTDTMSVDMIKKADEIERLARGVKNQMKR